METTRYNEDEEKLAKVRYELLEQEIKKGIGLLIDYCSERQDCKDCLISTGFCAHWFNTCPKRWRKPWAQEEG
jgi:hypothetical protein